MRLIKEVCRQRPVYVVGNGRKVRFCFFFHKDESEILFWTSGELPAKNQIQQNVWSVRQQDKIKPNFLMIHQKTWHIN
jgi:hypothetical protein